MWRQVVFAVFGCVDVDEAGVWSVWSDMSSFGEPAAASTLSH
jgi:hypothetical protein